MIARDLMNSDFPYVTADAISITSRNFSLNAGWVLCDHRRRVAPIGS
jgi:hypothetical protein